MRLWVPALGAATSLCRSGSRRRSRFQSCTKHPLQVLISGLGLCCLVYLTLLSRPYGVASYQQQQNTSLAQAATVSRQLKQLSLQQFSSQALQSAFRVAVLSTAKPIVRCKTDSTLPLLMSDDGSKILVAANMHNNEDLLPHFTLQMLELLLSHPSGSAFLSIYESGSTDSTGVLMPAELGWRCFKISWCAWVFLTGSSLVAV
ncbi:hypothetical protein ABBQ38_010571 [Trebouxia sp. C0009 RCD-2024]